jgi:tetratricopeptide (TPR) repeat protein
VPWRALWLALSLAPSLGCASAVPPPSVEAAPSSVSRGDAPEASPDLVALIARGVTLRENGDLDGSRAALEQALAIDSAVAGPHVEWAITAEALSLDPGVIASHYRAGARLAPQDARAQTLAADFAARQGDIEGALDGYDRAIAADARCVEAHVRRADLLTAKGAVEPAIGDYRAALALDGSHVPALAGLTVAAERAEEMKLAEEAHKKLINLFPSVHHYKAKLVAFYKRTGDDAAARALERALERAEPRDNRKLRKLRR